MGGTGLEPVPPSLSTPSASCCLTEAAQVRAEEIERAGGTVEGGGRLLQQAVSPEKAQRTTGIAGCA
jgi:hypothetical protein